MIRFIKYYSLEIYTAITMAFMLIAALIGDLSIIQKFVLVFAFLFLLHEWEEGVYPGGFFDKFSEVLQVESNEELRRITRVPVDIVLLIITIIPFCFHNYMIPVLMTSTLAILEGVVHIGFIKLFRMEKFYSPGMVTAEIMFVVSIIFYVYIAKHNMATGLDYLFGTLLMIITFIIMQRSLVKIIGIKNYLDVPKLVIKRIKNQE